MLYSLLKEEAHNHSALTQDVMRGLNPIDSFGVTASILQRYRLSGIKNFIGQVLIQGSYTVKDDDELTRISQAIEAIVKG
jgi:hypothetical protein